jgi:hypothetical protein
VLYNIALNNDYEKFHSNYFDIQFGNELPGNQNKFQPLPFQNWYGYQRTPCHYFKGSARK